MKNPIFATFAALGALIAPAFAADGWLTDLETAKKQAAAEKKDILVDFTGSDWCHWCVQLKKEVFDQKEFKDGAPKDFVLLEIDFPQEKEQPEDVKKANQALAEKYGVQGFPTVLLLDVEGRPYAQTGYQEGGAEPYMKHLAELRSHRGIRDEAFKKAADLKGLDRAKALAEAFSEMEPGMVLSFYAKEADEIIAADEKDVTGLVEKLKTVRDAEADMKGLSEMLEKPESKAFQEKLDAALKGIDDVEESKRGAEGIKRIDALIEAEKPTADQLQMALYTKLNFLEEMKDALPIFDAILKAGADTPLGKKAKRERSDVEEIVKGVEESKEDDAGAKPGKKEDGEDKAEAEKPSDDEKEEAKESK